MLEYFRGNLFANTPDILHEYLQTAAGRRSGSASCSPRRCRRSTASTAATSCSRTSRCRQGSEEYLDSEKYEIRARDWTAPGNLNAEIRRSTGSGARTRRCSARQPHVPPQRERPGPVLPKVACPMRGVERSAHRASTSIRTSAHETMVHVPLDALGIAPDEPYRRRRTC